MDLAHRTLVQLVEDLTDKRELELDQGALRKLKSICKAESDSYTKLVFDTWLERLKSQDARTRRHCVNLADELFRRSKVFRSLTAGTFESFLELSVGFRPGKPLPPPQQEAVQLRERALECVESWCESFGILYPEIRLGYRYLKNVMKMRFPELRAQAAAREDAAAARQERTRRINEEKYGSIKQDYTSTVADIGIVLDEMDASFRLVEQRPDPLPAAELDEEWEDVKEDNEADEDQGQPEATTAPSVADASILVEAPNPDVLDSLRGSYKLLTIRYLPMVQEWLRVVVKVDVGPPGSSEHNRRELVLRAAIKARDRILAAKSRYEAVLARSKGSASQEPHMVISASTDEGGGTGQQQVRLNVSTGRVQEQRRHVMVQSTDSLEAQGEPAALANGKAQLLVDVFGSDSEDETATRTAAISHQTHDPSLASSSAPVQPPSVASALRQYHFDPTYRQQPGTIPEKAAEQLKAAKRQRTSGSNSRDPVKMVLTEGLRNKLLAEAPAIPGGNHLAYWDSDNASLLNNKAMEVYNHWGAVDEHVPLPDHVISQFFTTRATYYEPPKANAKAFSGPQPAQKRTPMLPLEEESRLPKKSATAITAVGFGGVTNSSFIAARRPLQKPTVPSISSQLQPASNAKVADEGSKTAGGNEPTAGDGLPLHNPSGSSSGLQKSGGAAASQAVQRQELPHIQRSAKHIRGSAKSPIAPSHGRAQRQDAQKARDRAHNEAVLAAAGGDDADLARNLAEHEFQALQPSKARKGKKKEPVSVRERLSKKLLTGGATSRAIQDLDAVENEHFKEQESRRCAQTILEAPVRRISLQVFAELCASNARLHSGPPQRVAKSQGRGQRQKGSAINEGSRQLRRTRDVGKQGSSLPGASNSAEKETKGKETVQLSSKLLARLKNERRQKAPSLLTKLEDYGQADSSPKELPENLPDTGCALPQRFAGEYGKSKGSLKPYFLASVEHSAAASPRLAVRHANVPQPRASRIRSAEYVSSSVSLQSCPKPTYPEIAVVGRSNVGKSSLINMLTGRRALALVSKTPGKTQCINHFLINKAWYLVDLPGYGYAMTAKSRRIEWGKFTQEYFKRRSTLANVLLLVDSSVPPQSIDLGCAEWLWQHQVPFSIVFTKADKRKKRCPSAEENITAFEEALQNIVGSLPVSLVTSSAGLGKEDLLGYLSVLRHLHQQQSQQEPTSHAAA